MNEEAYKRYLADIEAILVKAQHPPVLSRRDCFAMAAMQGLFAGLGSVFAEGYDKTDLKGEIESAVFAADALIAALNEPQPSDTDGSGK